MSRSWSWRPPQRYVPPRPRSLWRRLVDYALAVIVLGLLILLAARLDPIETRKAEGAAVVNDGDTITLGT
ncbi:thermonuclease family protein, partial [Mesorhizobium sp. M6A.T.Ca.TU.002.02.2.1]